MSTDASVTNTEAQEREQPKQIVERLIVGFIAGFLGAVTFHQGVLAWIHNEGLTSREPWSLAPVPPLGVPAVVSLAFWGGIWGMALIFLLPRSPWRARYWVRAFLLGAILPSLVGWFLIAPLKGYAMLGGGQLAGIIYPLLLNGSWGIGTALFIQILFALRGLTFRRSL